MIRFMFVFTILLSACQTEEKSVPTVPALQKSSSALDRNSFEDLEKKEEGCELEKKQDDLVVQIEPSEFKLQGNEPGCEVK